MHNRIKFAVLASISIAVLGGCSSAGDKPTTAADKATFKGGQMPADQRAKFDAIKQQNNQNLADHIAKVRAGAGGQ